MISSLFDLFAFLLMTSASLVVASRNPVHSVLFMILSFCAASGLFLLIEVEFLAMIFVMVYVGAIAVLFLFVVMMLNTRLAEYHISLVRYLPLGAAIAFLFLIEVFFLLNTELAPSPHHSLISFSFFHHWPTHLHALTNVASLGQVLYSNYFFLFLLAGIILFLSMIAAIVLTMYRRTGVRRQDIYQQVSTDYQRTIYLTRKSPAST